MPDGVKCYGENAAKENRELVGKQVDYCGRGGGVFSNRLAKQGLSDKVTLEDRTAGAEGGNHVDIWEKNQNFTGHSVQKPWW